MIYFITQNIYDVGGMETVSRKLVTGIHELLTTNLKVFSIEFEKSKIERPELEPLDIISIDVEGKEDIGEFNKSLEIIETTIKNEFLSSDKIFIHTPWLLDELSWVDELGIPVYVWVHEGFFLKYSENNDYPDFYDMKKFFERNDKLNSFNNVIPVFMLDTHAEIYNAMPRKQKAVVISNPVAYTNSLNLKMLPSTGREVKILIVVNCLQRLMNKGIDLAMRFIRKSYEEGRNYKFTIVGSYNRESYKRDFWDYYGWDLLAESGGTVTVTGSQSNLLPFYHEADITFIPSRIEGFSNIAVESQSAGTPVLTCDELKVGSLIPSDIPKFKFDDLDSITDALERIINAKIRYPNVISTLEYTRDYVIDEQVRPLLSNTKQTNSSIKIDKDILFDVCSYYESMLKSVLPLVKEHLPELCVKSLMEKPGRRRLIQRCPWGLPDDEEYGKRVDEGSPRI